MTITYSEGLKKAVLSGAVSEANLPQREPEVRAAINALHSEIDRHQSIANRFNERLYCVAVDQLVVPAEGGISEQAASYGAPLANEINSLRILMRDIANGLESLYDRLEL